MFTKTRYKYAFMFGRLEHTLSRILFAELIVTYLLYLSGKTEALRYALPAAIGLWLGYWGSHILEKALHPNH